MRYHCILQHRFVGDLPDDDEVWFRGEISQWHRNLFLDVFTDDLDVILQLRRDGNDGGALSNSAFNKMQNLETKVQ